MNVKRNFFFFGFLFLAIIFIKPTAVVAYDVQQEVLGASAGNIAQIPPTTEGPGLLLPDSPLFFLDKIKQKIRLFLAFTPEAKAEVYVSVAGERFAELRFMLARKNRAGIYTDLQGMSENIRGASDQLALAKLSGRNVGQLAESINADIKQKEDALDILEKEETGSMRDQVIATQKSLLESKVNVENYLPSQDIAGEIQGDLKRELTENISRTTDSVSEIQRELAVLTKYSNDSNNNQKTQNVLSLQQKNVSDAQRELIKARQDIKNMNDLVLQLGDESAMAGESAIPTVAPMHK